MISGAILRVGHQRPTRSLLATGMLPLWANEGRAKGEK